MSDAAADNLKKKSHSCYSVEVHHEAACVQLRLPQNCTENFSYCLTDIGYLVNHGLVVNVNIIKDQSVTQQDITELVDRVGKLGVNRIHIVPYLADVNG